MDMADAAGLVERAVRHLYQLDSSLPSGINERSLTHRLAIYIEQELRMLDEPTQHLSVDCEYNRHLDDDTPKRLIGLYAGSVSPSDDQGTTVYPDAVVHQRGTDCANCIILEAKVQHTGNEEREHLDRLKLVPYRSQLSYEHAFFVLLNMESKTLHIEVPCGFTEVETHRGPCLPQHGHSGEHHATPPVKRPRRRSR